jgi:hypothetical protein
VLIDDPEDTIFGELIPEAIDRVGEVVYETELMENSGYLRGIWVDDKQVLSRLCESLVHLSDAKNFASKYGLSDDTIPPLVFAMGDGNHSLATAKACWELTKKDLDPRDCVDHPARYALVEIQNCQDPTLVFEPINRLIEGIDVGVEGDWDETCSAVPDDESRGGARLLNEFKLWLENSGQGPISIEEGEDGGYSDLLTNGGGTHTSIGYVLAGRRRCIHIGNPSKVLPVAIFTDFIDPWLDKNKSRIDYVHETTAIDRECTNDKSGNIGFVFPSMRKSDLFKTVILDGVLPRKTFSMGSSWDKRFYFEGKRISRAS